MGTCCTYFNTNIDNQNLHFTHHNNKLDESEKRLSRLKSKPSILREKELVSKFSLSKKDTNAIEEKENYEESIQLSKCSSMKAEDFNEIAECNMEKILLSDNIPPIESKEGNSGFINKEDFDFNECICNTCIKEEKKKNRESSNFFNKNKCKSLKRFTKKIQLTIKDTSSCETNNQKKKPYKRSRIKLLTN